MTALNDILKGKELIRKIYGKELKGDKADITCDTGTATDDNHQDNGTEN